METRETIRDLVLQTRKSAGPSRRAAPSPITTSRDGRSELSLYQDAPPTSDEIGAALRMLAEAFPGATQALLAVLAATIRRDSTFTAQRLADAVDHVIRTVPYQRFAVADVMGYGRGVPLYSYKEMCRMVTAGEAETKDFAIVAETDDGQVLRARRSDLAKVRI